MEQNSENKNFSANEFELKNRMNSGLNWFYWIAGLSIVNSILFFTNMNVSFVAGLGVTQVVDAIFKDNQSASYIGIIINTLFIIGFVLLGRFSKKSNVLIIAGIVIYSLDTLIFLIIKDWWSIGFHIFAIIGIISGLTAKIKLDKLSRNNPVISDPARMSNAERLEQLQETKENPSDNKN